jgi:hypothetical protein
MTPEERAMKIVAETRAWADAQGFQDACPSVETIADAIRAAVAEEIEVSAAMIHDLKQEIEVSAAMIHDLKQESSAYWRGAQDEREACILLAQGFYSDFVASHGGQAPFAIGNEIAQAIRARSRQPRPIILTREQMDAVPLSALQAQQSEAMADAALRRVERAFGLVRDGDSPLP